LLYWYKSTNTDTRVAAASPVSDPISQPREVEARRREPAPQMRETCPGTVADVGVVGGGSRRLREGEREREREREKGVGGGSGRFLARAVARLLLCKETGETVLFVDKAYDEAGGAAHTEARDLIAQQARVLAQLLSVPLFTSADCVIPPLGERGDDTEGGDDTLRVGGGCTGGVTVWRLVEVDGVAEYVWREGEVGYGVQKRGEGREVSSIYILFLVYDKRLIFRSLLISRAWFYLYITKRETKVSHKETYKY
jgi:hypothetical protein